LNNFCHVNGRSGERDSLSTGCGNDNVLNVTGKQKMIDDRLRTELYTLLHYKPTINSAGGNNS
jgi:hypothetical protein